MARGLSDEQLRHISTLEAACLAVDGGRLKLEYSLLGDRPAGVANDFLFWGGYGTGELAGFCGLYQYRPGEVEICGMVHPQWRRRGIATRLLDAAMEELAGRGALRVLLIVDRSNEAGRGFAARRSGVLDSSEHRMTQAEPPALQGAHERLGLRQATPTAADAAFVRECTAAGFGTPEETEYGPSWATNAAKTLVIEADGIPVGVIRVEREPALSSAGLYGFVVRPEEQGRGFGRGALSLLTRSLREEGISTVHLEVLVDNPAALHIYESCGFVSTGIEDYHLLPR